jgi:hypothetical protein
MISVQNHLRLLNGNSWGSLFIAAALIFASCSPKVRPITGKSPAVAPPVNEKLPEKLVEKKFSEATISLLIPFKLNQINLETASKSEVERASMAIDFYQGFKLGIDSAAAKGLNFKIDVVDTRDNNSQLDGLIKNGRLLNSDLVVGPVFPDGIKHLSAYSKAHNLLVVSPLAASHPADFGNPNLVSIANNIDLHVGKMGDYITKTYNPANTIVVLINPKTPSDEIVAAPVRSYFKNANKQFTFQEYASVFTMETKIIKGKQYVLVVTSADPEFVMPTLSKLAKMKTVSGTNIHVFGHPDWIKQSYSTENLQLLNTIITASYKINYNNRNVLSFIKSYRSAFQFEPGEYSFKGFDIGYYFGMLFSKYGADYRSHITKEKYKGLHNSFSFKYDEENGYINQDLQLLRYKNFELAVIE